MFVIGEDDKGNVIVKTTSSVGKSEQLIFQLGIILLQIKEIERIFPKLIEITGYISRDVPYQKVAEKYMGLLSMPSESLNDFAKSMVRLAVNNMEIEGPQRETHYKRKTNSRTTIRTWHQSKNTLKYKPYELRIYNKLLIVFSIKIFLTILAQ